MTFDRDPAIYIHIHIKLVIMENYNAMTILDTKYFIKILYHLNFPDTAKHYQ